MIDPLAQFRKRPVEPAKLVRINEPPIADSKSPYQAFAAKDKVERLKIRPAMEPWRAPYYNALVDIACNGSYGTNFVLMFTHMAVFVEGKNLQAIIAAIEAGTADFIQQFDSEFWPKPTDAAAPLIESIRCELYHKQQAASADSEKTGKQSAGQRLN